MTPSSDASSYHLYSGGSPSWQPGSLTVNAAWGRAEKATCRLTRKDAYQLLNPACGENATERAVRSLTILAMIKEDFILKNNKAKKKNKRQEEEEEKKKKTPGHIRKKKTKHQTLMLHDAVNLVRNVLRGIRADIHLQKRQAKVPLRRKWQYDSNIYNDDKWL